MESDKNAILPGTLNLMILKTLETIGSSGLLDCQAH